MTHCSGEKFVLIFCNESASVTNSRTESSQYGLEPKRHSSPHPKKKRKSISKSKTMHICIFDGYGIVHCKFAPPGQTVNQKCCLSFGTSETGVHREPRIFCNKWILHHAKRALTHSAGRKTPSWFRNTPLTHQTSLLVTSSSTLPCRVISRVTF